MRYQEKTWSCGAACIVNAIRSLGKKVQERTVRALAETSEAYGTNQYGMIFAIRELGYTACEFATDDRQAAWNWLRGALLAGKSVIICTEEWLHWVTVVGILGDRVVVIDPANFKVNKRENGVKIWKKNTLLKQWKYSRPEVPEEGDKRIYAISVGEKKK